MKTLVSTISALALGAASLAGCSSPGTVSPTVSAAEQTVYDWVCPVLVSGSLDSVAALWPSDLPYYADAKILCANGTILSPGTFIADFLIIEPIVAQFFKSKGDMAGYAKAEHFKAHFKAMGYRG